MIFPALLRQSDKGFGNLMIVKFEIIYQELLKQDNIVYLDGDITIKKNISEYLYNFSKESDIVFQKNDLRPSKPDLINVCAGFMYIKSNQKPKIFLKLVKNYKENLIGIKLMIKHILIKIKINLTTLCYHLMIFQTVLIIINIVQNLIHI